MEEIEYVVYHPGTGTILRAEEVYLFEVNELPADVDEWEEFMRRKFTK